jgi:hypothetical protein
MNSRLNNIIMKKYLFLSVLFSLLGIAYSQDRIVTQQGDTIHAKIMIVTDNDVSYKRYNDQEGATFFLSTGKIRRILWENGTVDNYILNRNVETVTQEVDDVFPTIEHRRGIDFKMSNGEEWDDSRFEYFLQGHRLDNLWQTFASGSRMFKTGRGLMIGGGSGLVLGAGMIFISVIIADGSILGGIMMLPLAIMGGIITLPGLVLVAVGLPLMLTGSAKRRNFVNEYNENYAGKHPSQLSENVVTWKVGLVGNGIGFALHF